MSSGGQGLGSPSCGSLWSAGQNLAQRCLLDFSGSEENRDLFLLHDCEGQESKCEKGKALEIKIWDQGHEAFPVSPRGDM